MVLGTGQKQVLMGRGDDGLVVCTHSTYSNDQSLNPAYDNLGTVVYFTLMQFQKEVNM